EHGKGNSEERTEKGAQLAGWCPVVRHIHLRYSGPVGQRWPRTDVPAKPGQGGTAASLWRYCPMRGSFAPTHWNIAMNAPSKKSKLIKGGTGDWEVVIGMEVHAQVTSQSKLFSGASTAFGGEPNSHVSLVDAAMPGMLPVINEECIKQAVRTGLGLRAKINL